MKWRYIVPSVAFVLLLGAAAGQKLSNHIWAHVENRVYNNSLVTIHDDAQHIICYAIVPDGTMAGAAISCVKLDGAK